MNLLASASEPSGTTRVLIALVVIGYIAYRAYIFFCRPELWAEMQRQKHERQMAEDAARRERKNKILGGVAGGVAKALLGAVFRNKHN